MNDIPKTDTPAKRAKRRIVIQQSTHRVKDWGNKVTLRREVPVLVFDFYPATPQVPGATEIKGKPWN